jgi:hypothetical protein
LGHAGGSKKLLPPEVLKPILGKVGEHYGFGRRDLLEVTIPELMFFAECAWGKTDDDNQGGETPD